MAVPDSDGRMATTLLTDWLRYLLGNARHRPITAQDLVFRDLYALVSEHPRTRGPLGVLYDEIRRFAAVTAEVSAAMSTAVDTAAAEDRTFAVQLEELLHVLRPLTPDEPPQPKGDYFAHPALVPPILGGEDGAAHPYFATDGPWLDDPEPPEPPPVPVTIYLCEEPGHDGVEAAVAALLAAADVEITDREDSVGSWFRCLRARPAHPTDEAARTATLLRNLGPVLAALHAYAEAILRVGALLLVKQGARLTVQELTKTQQVRLDREPDLATAPALILPTLESDKGFTSSA